MQQAPELAVHPEELVFRIRLTDARELLEELAYLRVRANLRDYEPKQVAALARALTFDLADQGDGERESNP